MNLIKLDAIASTNTYLKNLYANSNLENLTVVTAENQFAGKGQRGQNWTSEPGTNLSFSILLKDFLPTPDKVFDLNILVSLSVNNILNQQFFLPSFIKWPNDIVAENKKIAGILIENILKADGNVHSIIGIGINVNQINFDSLPNASSLAVLLNKQIDKDQLLISIYNELKTNLSFYSETKITQAWKNFHDVLFKKDIVSTFENNQGQRFVGIIRSVTEFGLLTIERENEVFQNYALKEIKLLY